MYDGAYLEKLLTVKNRFKYVPVQDNFILIFLQFLKQSSMIQTTTTIIIIIINKNSQNM